MAARTALVLALAQGSLNPSCALELRGCSAQLPVVGRNVHAAQKRKISDVTHWQEMFADDEELLRLMVHLKSELEDTKREKKEYFNKLMVLSKNLSDATRKMHRVVKSNREAPAPPGGDDHACTD